MSDARDRFEASRHMDAHLLHLRTLLHRPVGAEDLLSLAETTAVRVQASARPRLPVWTIELPFAAKASERFRAWIRTCIELNPEPVYIWTDLANVCGLLRPTPLREIDFDFELELDPRGIVSILSADYQDKMILDFSEDDGVQTLELEVSGPHWTQAQY